MLLPDGGKICMIEGLAGTSGNVERAEGFREGISKNPNLEIIATNNADWLREKAITVAEEMLQVYDDIDLFYCLNDPMAEGAYIAARNAGRDHGYGIFNVNDRIRLSYGREYGLHYRINEYGGITVELVCPAVTQSEEEAEGKERS